MFKETKPPEITAPEASPEAKRHQESERLPESQEALIARGQELEALVQLISDEAKNDARVNLEKIADSTIPPAIEEAHTIAEAQLDVDKATTIAEIRSETGTDSARSPAQEQKSPPLSPEEEAALRELQTLPLELAMYSRQEISNRLIAEMNSIIKKQDRTIKDALRYRDIKLLRNQVYATIKERKLREISPHADRSLDTEQIRELENHYLKTMQHIEDQLAKTHDAEEREELKRAWGRTNLLFNELLDARSTPSSRESLLGTERDDTFSQAYLYGTGMAREIQRYYKDELSSSTRTVIDILTSPTPPHKLHERARYFWALQTAITEQRGQQTAELDLDNWQSLIQVEMDRYQAALEQETTRQEYPLSEKQKVVLDIRGPMDESPEIDVRIVGEGHPPFSLSELGPPGTLLIFDTDQAKFKPPIKGEGQFSANVSERRVFIPIDAPRVQQDFARSLLPMLHEIGHLHQDEASDELIKERLGAALKGDKRSSKALEEQARRERNAWARALTYVRALRHQYSIDLLAPYKDLESAQQEIDTSLGTYELGALKELGDTFRGLFLRREIPERSHELRESNPDT